MLYCISMSKTMIYRALGVIVSCVAAAAFVCAFPAHAAAAGSENQSTQDKVIASAFRIVAKAFVAAVDLDKLKDGMTARIDKTGDLYFHARYMDIYEHIYEQPFFTQTWGLRQDLTKEEAMAIIRSFDKPKLYALIDAIPDIVITNEFKRYLWKRKEALPTGSDPENFSQAIGRMIDDFKRKYLSE